MISVCINTKALHGNRPNPRDSQSYMSDIEISSLTSIQKHTNFDSKVSSTIQMCRRSLTVSTDNGLKKIWDQQADEKQESLQC